VFAGHFALAGTDGCVEDALGGQRQQNQDAGDREAAVALLIGVLGEAIWLAGSSGMLTVEPSAMTTRRSWKSQSFDPCD
jgi:hypothetical protein